MSARSDIVAGAVALLNPDKNRRAEAVNAVNVALSDITATESDMRYAFHRNTKHATKAAGRLGTAIRRLQDVLKDPNIPDHLLRIFPNKEIGEDGIPKEHYDPKIRWPSDPILQQDITKIWLDEWRQQAEAAEDAPRNKVKFHFKAEKKLVAAQLAYSLLQQFNRDISAAKDSTFCKLAAALHGTPKANFHHPCNRVLSAVREREKILSAGRRK